MELIPDLATQVSVSDDRLSWTLTLRDDVRFGDGSRLTAKDVAFTYQQLQDGKSVHDASMIEQISIESLNTLRFDLAEPDLGFADLLASVGIVAHKVYQQSYGQNPLGSGPFRFVRWDKGQQIVLERNPYYYGQQPAVQKLIIVFASEDSLISLVRSGQIDLASVPQRYASLVSGNHRLVSVETNDNRGIVWPVNPLSKERGGNEVTSDVAIRRAIDQVINRELLVSGVLQGYGRPAFSLADGLPWGPTIEPRKLADIDEISLQLELAGWFFDKSNLIRERDGVKAIFTLYYPAGDSVREQLSLAVAAMAEPLGIEVNVRGASWTHIGREMSHHPVLMGFGSHNISEMFLVYGSENAGEGWYNSGYYANGIVDFNLSRIKQASGIEHTRPYWDALYQQLDRDLPWSWLVNINHLYAVNQCLDIGEPLPEPHQHGWPITRTIEQWQWSCP
ncbi:ABC transporter substrate-binding protein [Photobacterium sp. DA100]|uniref:ABC transporter substrate-binding protein n=1 Tax=Photobacterium sp. DA100 TaxID=3027472 RepID=UPI00247B2456|nr:ABC transporter substrate-binding protein [Photobacterium sp. DA100]WEM41190.1 ABC transporter substrate-binding protein [Photobacterium sp. DA100]